MSDTLSPLEVAADQEEAIGQMVQSLEDELTVTASVGGSAELELLQAPEVAKLHPYALPVIALKKALKSPVAPAALPTTIGPFNTGRINFNNGVPVSGWASLTLHSDGTCQFSGHFHDSGAPSYNIEFVWVVVDSDGTAYTFTVSGRMHGTFEAGSRDFNWNITRHSNQVAANWGKLCAGWRWRWSAHVNWNVAAALNAVIDVIKAAGTVIGVIVAVI